MLVLSLAFLTPASKLKFQGYFSSLLPHSSKSSLPPLK